MKRKRARSGGVRNPVRNVALYKPPQRTPAEGVEVIFAEDGVLIGGGYFPLSITGGRRLEGVRYIDSSPPSIELSTTMTRTTEDA